MLRRDVIDIREMWCRVVRFWASAVVCITAQPSVVLVDRQVTAELLQVFPGNPGTATALVTWSAFDNDRDGIGGVIDVEAYELQYGLSGSGAWSSVGDILTGLDEDTDASTEFAAKQRIFTQADAGETINDGYFRLALSYEGSSPSPMGGRAMAGVLTPPIPFDASEATVKAAIESLEQIDKVQVFRNALGANGAVEWVVLFDVVDYDKATEDPLPLLTLYTETISAKWTGSGDQVSIQFLRSPPSSPDKHRRLCSDVCSHEIAGLPTGKSLTFRVRARYSYDMGWSSWSASSGVLVVPATRLPASPSAPELMSTTTSWITITWRMRRDLLESNSVFATELFPVTRFHAQQQCDSDIGWTTISEQIVPGSRGNKDTFSTVAASLERPPGSSCSFRVAAITANGQGPFSLASPRFSTQTRAPGIVGNLRVFRDPLRVSWDAPTDLGGHPLESIRYDVDYRVSVSTTWTRLAASLVNRTSRVARLSEAPLASYTSYVARVRAIGEDQIGGFSLSPPFLTDYAVEEEEDDPVKPTPGVTQVLMAASRQLAGNTMDWYYIQLTGNGGSGGRTSDNVPAEPGENGAVLVFPVTWSGERLSELSFFYTGSAQTYRVPSKEQLELNAAQVPRRIVALDIYAWGAGGAGARSGNGHTIGISNGGGGAFVRGVVRVKPGDNIDIFVGGGGRVDGFGGYHGGGNGGTGDFSGGGGGGASEVRLNGRPVLIAAGGGGAGSTDYCCAHGGGGGLEQAESGLAADATSIPLDLAVTGQGPRNEYHSSNVPGDTRDSEGMPARHQHLDWGFAGSTADYSVLATGGEGASTTGPGRAGTAGSFRYSLDGKCLVNTQTSLVDVMVAPLEAARWPSNGQRGRGGSGQSGHQAGGGGGGGLYGGGGGGAGLDGAGGGGGSSFISVADLLNFSTPGLSDASLRPPPIGESIWQLQVIPVTSSTVRVLWNPPGYGFSQLVEGFVIEMANRSVNEDFRVVRLITLPNADVVDNSGNVTVNGLAPRAAYRFRVKPLLYDGRGTYSAVVTLRMPPKPANVWHRCVTRTLDEESTRAGMRTTSTPPLLRLPSARRGHSLTPLDNFLYLFGGMAKSYECNRAHKVPCLLQDRPNEVSDELWRYDLLTETWWKVPQPALRPSAREKHSMSVVSNRLLLFGGRKIATPDPSDATTWAPQAFNDIWELSVSSTTARKVSTTLDSRQPTGLAIPDGGEVFSLGKKSDSSEQLCVSNLAVTVQVTHACPHKLRMQLFGPGPATFPGRQQTVHFPVNSQARETTWSDAQGLGSFQGDKRTTETAPSTRAFPVLLQSPEEAADGIACSAGAQTFTFVSVPGAGGASVASSSPIESLSVFHQLPVAGNWTLELADTAADGLVGTLDSWDISFEVSSCIPAFTWRDLSAVATGTAPSPRFQHSAVVYQNSLFIYGGTGGGTGLELHDMYRLDYTAGSGTSVSTAKWTQLASLTDSDSPSAAERRMFIGRQALLTPFELMAVGRGLLPARRSSLGSDGGPSASRFESQLTVRLRELEDPINGWELLPVGPFNASSPSEEMFPVPRYWAATAFVASPPAGNTPRAFLFGGQDDTTLLDDLWSLELAQIAEDSPLQQLQTQKLRVCAWRLESSVYQALWASSCGAVTAAAALSKCTLEMLLLYAWCEDGYQSILI